MLVLQYSSVACLIKHISFVLVQEHLALMGVPALRSLAVADPYPPFNIDHHAGSTLKRFAGNASQPAVFVSTNIHINLHFTVYCFAEI